MKTCTDKTVKALLPAYREQGLDQPDQDRVRMHLESCADCRVELSLLELLVREAVPDPGAAFWTTMPERVYRAVREEKEGKGRFSLPRMPGRFILPRWAWAAAAAGIVLLIFWAAFLAPQISPVRSLSPGYELSEEIMAADPPQISELDGEELNTIASWAGAELASIAREIEHGMMNGSDADLYEELRQLNAGEVERLSTMIDQWKQEG
jgi:putative zinc finger protein